MGFSWAMSGAVTLPSNKVAAYRGAAADPTRYDDWSSDFGEVDEDAEPSESTVDEVLDYYRQADANAIAWNGDRLELRAVFSNDSDCWLTFRWDIVAAIRTAADFGGAGEAAITGYVDGGPNEVYRVTCSKDGKSSFDVLTAKRAEPVAKRIYDDVKPIVDAMVAAFRERSAARKAAEAARATAKPAPAAKPAKVVQLDTAKAATAAVAGLRKKVPSTPNVGLQGSLLKHADVVALRDAGSPHVHQAARAKLDELTKGSKLARLKTADHVYVYALALILDAYATDDDLDVLFRLWSEAPGFMLMNPGGIAKRGVRGAAFLAKLFAKPSKNEYTNKLQPAAARALLETDPDTAAVTLDKLVRPKSPKAAEWATKNLIELLAAKPATERWATILLAAADNHAKSDVGHEAICTLAAWKHPKAAALVVASIGGTFWMEKACHVLQKLGDRSIVPALKQRLAKLGKSEKRDRDLLEQCIAALSK